MSYCYGSKISGSQQTMEKNGKCFELSPYWGMLLSLLSLLSNRFLSRLMDQKLIHITVSESVHWCLCHLPGLLTWFFITLCDFLEFWIAKGFCWNFVLILTFSFYEYFTEVLCAAFYKILIKYFDHHLNWNEVH